MKEKKESDQYCKKRRNLSGGRRSNVNKDELQTSLDSV
jgi:hypothetical protein